MDWTENDCYVRGIYNHLDNFPNPVRIASFDLDDTIIQKPKKPFDVFKFVDYIMQSDIKKLIKILTGGKYIIVIFTNQGGMSMNSNFDVKGWMKMIDKIRQVLFDSLGQSFYFAVYAAKKYDLFRKPNLGMWQLMRKDLADQFGVHPHKGGVSKVGVHPHKGGSRNYGSSPEIPKVDISSKSFFVGDAAGRIQPGTINTFLHPKMKGDRSDTDRKFALNIGIKFLTPEEFYTHNKKIEIPYVLTGFDPTKFIQQTNTNNQRTIKFKPRSKEMIILIGPPGSGKTEFVNSYVVPHGYVHINRDICVSNLKCLSYTAEALKSGKNVVIDNTNPDVDSRAPYIAEALKYSYKHIRCIVLTTPIELARHLNNVRHTYSGGLDPKINSIVYNIYKKKYEKPSKNESFDVIEYVDFEFDFNKLNDPLWKRLFMMWSES